MSSKTKIVVLHLKELIYTGIFVVLGILFLILMIVMFLPKTAAKETSASANTAVPGVYTTSLIINDNVVDVEVTVDENNINDIQIVNLDEAVTTMFPLIEPVFDDLAEKILKTQSLENITYADDNKYTSTVLLNAIKASLQKASPSPSASEDPAGSGSR